MNFQKIFLNFLKNCPPLTLGTDIANATCFSGTKIFGACFFGSIA